MDGSRYNPLVHLAQTMMYFLAAETSSVLQPEQTGLMDEITRQALLDFQQLNALPMTGVLDKHTWKHLALHYSAAAAHDAIRG